MPGSGEAMRRERAKGVPPRRARAPPAPRPVPAATSLPPLVAGPPRGLLAVTVGRVVWAGPAPPAIAAALCLRWWGDASAGTFFRAGPGRSQARFPVRCGPAQLAAYLAGVGMGTRTCVCLHVYTCM